MFREKPLHQCIKAASCILPVISVFVSVTSIADVTNTNSTQSEQNIEEIWVHGDSEAIAEDYALAAKIPGGVTVLDTGKLREKSLQNLADVLRYVPGVWAASDNGGQGVFFSSRGSNLDATNFDNNGIKLLQDGLPVTTADGNNHNRIIDPLSSRSATFARGANAYSLGASTLGGAINFKTPTGRDISGVNLRVNGGSHELSEGRLTAGGVTGAGTLDGLVTLEARSWGGYRDQNREDRTGLYANGGWQISEQLDTRLYFTYLDNDQEIPGSLSRQQFEDDPEQASASASQGNFQLDVTTWRVASKSHWQISDNQRLEFGVSLEEQELFHPIVQTPFFSLLIDTDHQDIGGVVRYEQDLKNHQITLGLNYGRNSVEGEHFSHEGARPIALSTLVDNSAENWEFYIQDEWQVSHSLRFITALQAVIAERNVESRSAEPGNPITNNPQGDYDAVNPRIGILWDYADNSTLYANVSRLYEPPTNFELEDDVRGNDQPLDAMNGVVAEIGTRGGLVTQNNNRWNWDVAVYYASINDEILSREDPNAPGQSLATNVDSTIHAGIEALLTGDIQIASGNAWSVAPTLSATLNYFKFDDDPNYGSNDLPAAPDFSLRGELIARHTSGFYVGPVIDWVGERWADFENTYKVDDYQLLGLRGGYDTKQWRTFVEVHNLFDENYVSSHSVRDQAGEDEQILSSGLPFSLYAGVEFRL